MILALTLISGALWRRWWGAERPGWAPAGYRFTQALVGFGLLCGLSLWAGDLWYSAAARAGLAVGFLAWTGVSIPHVWALWAAIDARIGPLSLPFFRGHTAFAEATAGALIFYAALVI
jgi:hypothetical protein